MVFTNAQITAFFEGNDQMGLSHRTRLYLQLEGLDHPRDLVDFVKSDAWDQVLENCKRPPQVADPANPGQLMNQSPFRFPSKSLLRLKVAARVIEYYNRTGRDLTAGNLAWNRLANFQIEWDTLVQRRKANDELTLPVVSKQLSITSFFEAYETFAGEFIGQTNCPLAWIYRDAVAVDAVAPALAADQPYSETHGSVAEEMVQRIAHTHPLYRVDNALGYSQLVTATLGTQYASTIAPFKRMKDGRGALAALKAQFAGRAYWDKEVRLSNDFLMNTKWNGMTAFTLHGFLAKHRASYNTLQRCADHVPVELPSDRTRVGYLISNIECQDKDVTTAISHIRLDDGANGMREDFERSVAFLLPTDPVKKKRGSKRVAAQISAAQSTAPGGKGGKKVSFKPNVGKTGVERRYYKQSEYRKLSLDQKLELKEHRKATGDYGPNGKKGAKVASAAAITKADVSAMLRNHDKEKEKKAADEAEKDALKMGLINDLKGFISAEIAAAMSSAGMMKKGLQRAGASANVAAMTTNAIESAQAQDEAAERCAASLLNKFGSIGSKAGKKKSS